MTVNHEKRALDLLREDLKAEARREAMKVEDYERREELLDVIRYD